MNKNLADVIGNFISTELDYIEQSNNEIENLQQENEQLRKENFKIQARADRYKYIIDKAIFELRKYKLARDNDDFVSLSDMYEFLIYNSIEILKGDKND